jgi:hypothetical protein
MTTPDEADVPTFATWLTLVTAQTPMIDSENLRKRVHKYMKQCPFDPLDLLAFFVEREINHGFGDTFAPLVNLSSE